VSSRDIPDVADVAALEPAVALGLFGLVPVAVGDVAGGAQVASSEQLVASQQIAPHLSQGSSHSPCS